MGISFSLAHTGRFGEVTERVCGIERVATTPRIRILPCSHGWLGDLGLINTFLQGPGGKGFSWERNFGIRESVLWVPPGMTPNFFRFFFLFYFFLPLLLPHSSLRPSRRKRCYSYSKGSDRTSTHTLWVTWSEVCAVCTEKRG